MAAVTTNADVPSASTVPAGVSIRVPAASTPSASAKPTSWSRRASPVPPAKTPTRASRVKPA